MNSVLSDPPVVSVQLKQDQKGAITVVALTTTAIFSFSSYPSGMMNAYVLSWINGNMQYK